MRAMLPGDVHVPREPHVTTIAAESEPYARRRMEPDVNVLVIAWCRHDPQRVGELAVVPTSGTAQVLGRGSSEGGAAHAVLSLAPWTARSCFSAAARDPNVPKFLRLPDFASFFFEYSRYSPDFSFRIMMP